MTGELTKSLRNQNGLAALSLAALVSVIGLIAISISLNSYLKAGREVQRLRIKQALHIREFIIQKIAVQPSSYINCNSSVGFSSCTPDPKVWNRLSSIPLSFAHCPPDQPICGLEMLNPSLSNRGVFTASLRYNGINFSFKPIAIEVDVPSEVLQSSQAKCKGGVFGGFDINGRLICSSLPSCSSGYMEDFDLNSMSVTCGKWPNAKISTGSDMLTGLIVTLSDSYGYKSSIRNPVSRLEK